MLKILVCQKHFVVWVCTIAWDYLSCCPGQLITFHYLPKTYICWLCFHPGQWHNGGKCELRRTTTKDKTSWRIMSGRYWQNKCSRASPPWPPWGRNDNKKIPCYIFFLGTKEKWKFNQDRERPVERSSHG